MTSTATTTAAVHLQYVIDSWDHLTEMLTTRHGSTWPPAMGVQHMLNGADDPMGGAERAPRPPAMMRTPCADCAYRPGSPELDEAGARLPEDEPFFCHQGLPVSADGRYQPVAMFRGLPLGAMVCAGWWAMATGEQLPAAPYREIPLGERGVDRMWGDTARANIDRAAGEA